MSWNDERVETLKRLWAEGLSASHIATELGGITRNAVIGKVHRLGISGRAKSPAAAAPRPRKARVHQQMIRVARPLARGNTALATAFDYEIEAEPEVVGNVVLMGQRGSLLNLPNIRVAGQSGIPAMLIFSSAVDRRPAVCPIVRTTAASPINPPMCGATASHSFSDQLRATATGLRLANARIRKWGSAMYVRLLGSLAIVVLATVDHASAADIPVRAPVYKAPVISPNYTWTGLVDRVDYS